MWPIRGGADRKLRRVVECVVVMTIPLIIDETNALVGLGGA